VTEQAFHFGIGITESTQQGGCWQFAVFIYFDVDDVVDVGLKFEPGATVRDHGGAKSTLTVGVYFSFVVDTRAAYDLRNDNALSTVDDEGTAVGHHWDVADVDLLLFDLAHLAIDKAHLNTQLLGVAGIECSGFFRSLGLIRLSVILECVAGQEVQLQPTGVVLDRTESPQFFC
jgi:hypothetical protein